MIGLYLIWVVIFLIIIYRIETKREEYYLGGIWSDEKWVNYNWFGLEFFLVGVY